MTDEPVLGQEVHGAVVVLRLNRPQRRNALNRDLAAALCEAVAAAQQHRVIVLTGADPAFCAGLDLRDLGVERLLDLPDSVAAVAASSVPVIAAVNGPAVTGGLELALACDFIVASERASFADTHARVGVFPGSVLLELPRRIGMARAREMSMTGNFVDAAQAEAIGLVNSVVPHDSLLATALGLATAIAEQDPALIARMRRAWTDTQGLPREEAQQRWWKHARAAGGEGASGAGIAAHRDAVLERARAVADG
jgi:enoyl-CoA hydratase